MATQTQKQKEKEKAKKSSTQKMLEEKFLELKSKATHKRVKLVTSVICGCGWDDVWFYRNVPPDSKLKDGDRVKSVQADDVIIED